MHAKEEVEYTAEKTLRDYISCGLVEPKAAKMLAGQSQGVRPARHAQRHRDHLAIRA